MRPERSTRALLVVLAALSTSATLAEDPRAATRLFVLSVGVDTESAHGKRDRYAQDVSFLRKALVPAEGLYEVVQSRQLAGTRATRQAVQGGLEWLAREADAASISLVVFSAHGRIESGKGFAFVLARGAKDASDTLLGSELGTALARIRGKVIVFVDACHAGALADADAARIHGAAVVTACTADEESSGQDERPDRPHGYFVIALCEALDGLADSDRDGLVTLREVQAYVKTRSAALRKRQRPVVLARPECDGVLLARVDPGFTPQQLWTPPVPRNPFGEVDVPDPDGADVHALARKATPSGGDDDPNAEAWAKNLVAGAEDSLDGEWESRWRPKDDSAWRCGSARVRCVGERIHVLARHDEGEYLIELHRREKGVVTGRYVHVDRDGDSSPFVGKVVGPERIDGQWSGGRWDLRRKIEKK